MPALPLPPGPKGAFLIGNARPIQRDPTQFLLEMALEHGPVAMGTLGPRRFYVVSGPDELDQVLVREAKGYTKHQPLIDSGQILFGDSMLITDGAKWQKLRRLAAPAFHHRRIEAYAQSMAAAADRLVAGFSDGARRDLHDDFMALALDVVCDTLFGTNLRDDAASIGRSMTLATETFIQRTSSPLQLPAWVPTPVTLRLKRATREIDAIIFRIIEERRKSAEDRGDLLSMLLAARDEEDGKGLDDTDLRNELVTFFFAGHETTALAMMWASYLVGTHPEVDAKLHAEARAVLQGRTAQAADFPQLKYADAVVREAMRLYPPAWAIGRQAKADGTLGAFRIEKGTMVFASPWVSHRLPHYFPEPEAFRPERWADDLAKKLPRFAYFPFGGGPRICIGNTFAMMEAVLVLASLAQRWRFEIAAEPKPELQATITLRSLKGMPATVRAR
jgi:cytochrome P450